MGKIAVVINEQKMNIQQAFNAAAADMTSYVEP
jgi:hypothetical protein